MKTGIIYVQTFRIIILLPNFRLIGVYISWNLWVKFGAIVYFIVFIFMYA